MKHYTDEQKGRIDRVMREAEQAEKLTVIEGGGGSKDDYTDFSHNVIPERGFLKDFLDYTSEFCDAPRQFLYFAGLFAAGTVLRRRVGVKWGDKWIFPNLWVLFVAKSTAFRKSTARDTATDLLKAHDRDLVHPEEFSPEGLITHMAEYPQGCLDLDEFGTFLDQSRKDYMRGTRELLTKLYDSPYDYKRMLKSGEIMVNRPFLAIIGTSTVDWFTDKIQESDIRGGFLGRFLLIPAWDRSCWYDMPPEANEDTKRKLLGQLKHLQEVSKVPEGKECHGIGLTPEAREIYKKWIRKHENQEIDDPRLATLMTRLGVAAVKLAIINQVTDKGVYDISGNAMSRAIDTVQWIKSQYGRLMDDFTITPFDKDRKRIQDILEGRKGKTDHSTALRISKLDAKRFASVIASMREAGIINIVHEGQGREKRKIYHLREKKG